MASRKRMSKSRDVYWPIFDPIGEPCITLDMIFNPYYPDKVKWRCKSSRKNFKKGVIGNGKSQENV